mgnify:FL=1
MVSSLVARLGRCRAIMAHPKLLAHLTPDRKLVWGRVELPASIFGCSIEMRKESETKKLELQVFLKERNIDACCIQERHLNSSHRFSIRGYETIRRDRKDRILTLVKNTHAAAEVYTSEDEDTEVLYIKLLLDKNALTIYNLYSSPNKQLRPVFQPDPDRWIIMGDFNSHSPIWGYDDLNHKGDELEDWIITHNMVLINKAPQLSTPELGEQRAVQIWPSLPMM